MGLSFQWSKWSVFKPQRAVIFCPNMGVPRQFSVSLSTVSFSKPFSPLCSNLIKDWILLGLKLRANYHKMLQCAMPSLFLHNYTLLFLYGLWSLDYLRIFIVSSEILILCKDNLQLFEYSRHQNNGKSVWNSKMVVVVVREQSEGGASGFADLWIAEVKAFSIWTVFVTKKEP